MPMLNFSFEKACRRLAIPSHIIRSIGSAPKAGRPRWLLLAEMVTGLEEDGILASVLGSSSFKQLPSNRRFEMLYSTLSRPVRKKKDSYRWIDPEGRRIVKIERGGNETRLSFDDKLEPNFGDFVARQLDDLFSQFKAGVPEPGLRE
jgi:ParB family transcriptional regulator, chromosome partitioning protein